MTPTAELADIVVPKTTALEEDEIRLQPGGPLITMTQAVISPRGEARNDLEIARGLLEKMRSAAPSPQNFLPWQNRGRVHRISARRQRRDARHVAPRRFRASIPMNLENFAKFPSPTGKVELYSEAIASIGGDPLPNYRRRRRATRADPASQVRFPADACSPATARRLIIIRASAISRGRRKSRPIRKSLSIRRRRERLRSATISGFASRRRAQRGSCRLKVKISDATPEGVVSTGMGWWRPGSMLPGSGAFDVNINAAHDLRRSLGSDFGLGRFARHPLPHHRGLDPIGDALSELNQKHG